MAPEIVLSIVLLLIIVEHATKIPAQVTPEPCVYNTELTLANCSARNLDFVPWGLHKSIISLDISGNRFPVVANQSFIGYNYITHLYLKNNSIHTLEARAFYKLDYLTTLDLANNKLVLIPVLALQSTARTLLQLNLSGNKIQGIPKGIFQSFGRLQLLDLTGNSIFRIEHGAFAGLTSMKEFKIRHNALAFLPLDSFADFPEDISKVQLYDNRWYCDCKLRWLRQWLNSTDPEVWNSTGYYIRCDGPSIVREKPLSSLHLDELACEVQMKTSSSSRELVNGVNTSLLCKYTSVPEAEAKWLRNSDPIDIEKYSKKYNLVTNSAKGHRDEWAQISELKIIAFGYEDIGTYECYVQNIRGFGSTEYRLTLEGVPHGSVTPSPHEDTMSSSGVDTLGIAIAVGIVCGIILVVGIGVLIFCSVNRVQRKRQAKHEAIVENVKKHFISNSETAVSNGEITGGNETKINKSVDDKLHNSNEEDRPASKNMNDTTAAKRPISLDETEPLYTYENPESPFSNNGSYLPLAGVLTDRPDYRTPPLQHARAPSSRYEHSHAGSATPLLDRYTPSVFDSDEPVEDYAHYPVYDSLTNSIHHPHVDGSYRNGSTSGYGSYHSGDDAKRHNNFHYQNSGNGSMPQTPGSTRSAFVLTPRLADMRVYEGSRPDLYRTMPNSAEYPDYRDYRNVRYPETTPPPHRMTATTKKSKSVGNLGFTPPGPRKPPRIFQSREYIELTPQDMSGDYVTSPGAHSYSQNYGITPGTPV